MNDNKPPNNKQSELKAKVSSSLEEVKKTTMSALKDDVLLSDIKQKAAVNSISTFDRIKNSTISVNPVARIFKFTAWIYVAFVLLGFVGYIFNLPSNDFIQLFVIGVAVSFLALIPALFMYAIGEIIDLLTEIRNSFSSNVN